MDDIAVLRELASRLAELAARPVEQEKKAQWTAHNELKAVRPLVFCDPENGWNEIVRTEELCCQDELHRDWEWRLRCELFWAEQMGDDKVTDSRFAIKHVFTDSGFGLGVKIIGGERGGAYRWDPPLKNYADLDKLSFHRITVDEAQTERLLDRAHGVFDGILDVTLKNGWWWTLGLTQTAAFLRGLEQLMLDMYDEPENLHKLMAFLRDDTLSMLDFLEANNLLSLNSGNDYVGSGGFGFTSELPRKNFGGHVETTDLWGFAESQETTSVSPRQFEAFVLPYQLPILSRFGLNCYGCCEPLNYRWEAVSRIPRLRRVSVSPWADIQDMAQKLGNRYIFSMKPNPADLAVPSPDWDRIRMRMRETLQLTRGCVLEIVMKDNHTIGNNPDNVVKWCRITREEIGRM